MSEQIILNKAKLSLFPEGELRILTKQHIEEVHDFWPHSSQVFGPSVKLLSYQLIDVKKPYSGWVEIIDGVFPFLFALGTKQKFSEKTIFPLELENLLPQGIKEFNFSRYEISSRVKINHKDAYGILDYYDCYTSVDFLESSLVEIIKQAKIHKRYVLFINLSLNGFVYKTKPQIFLDFVKRLPKNVLTLTYQDFMQMNDLGYATVDLFLDKNLISASNVAESVFSKNGILSNKMNIKRGELVAEFAIAPHVKKMIYRDEIKKKQLTNYKDAIALSEKMNISQFLEPSNIDRISRML